MSKNSKKRLLIIPLIATLCLTLLTAGVVIYNFWKKPHYTAKDLIWNGETVDGPQSITSEQAKEDIDLLLYALDYAYGGKDFIDAHILAKAKKQLKNIPSNKPINTDTLWHKIHEAFLEIPDHHLVVLPSDNLMESVLDGFYKLSTSDDLSFKNLIKNLPMRFKSKFRAFWKNLFQTRGVGSNKNTTELPWFIETVPSWKKFFSQPFSWVTEQKLVEKNILLIAITRFPHPESKEWEGFLTKVQAALNQADAIILDVRDSTDSYDSMAYSLAKILYDSTNVPDPVDCIYFKNTPEAYTIQANYIKQLIQEGLSQGDSTSTLQKHYDDLLEKVEKAKQKNSPKYDIIKRPFVPTPTSLTRKPIVILTNKNCRASGETMVDLLEAHPHATKIGENTAGCIHFGNVGTFLLPHSKLKIKMPCQYRAYRDKRFIERTGIPPHIYVPAGKDAFDMALTFLKQKLGTD